MTRTPVSACEHEPLKHCNSFDELAMVWNGKTPYVGVSDSGLVPVLGRILGELYPRTLIVRRSPIEVLRSLKAFMGDAFNESAATDYLAKSSAYMDACAKHKLVREVCYDALNDAETVRWCFDWLMPGNVHFDPDMMHMRIQVDRAWAMQEAQKPHSHWYR